MHPHSRPALRLAIAATVTATVLSSVVVGSASGAQAYQVRPGDTVWELARRHGTSVSAIVAINRLLADGHRIFAGQRLRLPGLSAAPAPARPGTRRVVTHTVRRGDTLWGLARRYHTSPGAIAARNRLRPTGVLRLGSRLVITAPARPTRRASRGATASRPPLPRASRGAVTGRAAVRSLVTRTARSNGVDPSLALAVAWQESGWNQRAVSSAGALGVMQVLPSTGRWISGLLGRPINLRDTRDNVFAGTWYLRYLRSRTSSTREAVGAYYQGIGAIKRRGPDAGTRRYVANVEQLRRRFR